MNFRLGIEQWNTERLTPNGLNLLSSGYGFTLLRHHYDKWNNILASNTGHSLETVFEIHCYLYLKDEELSFLLVDSISDEREDYRLDETVFIRSFGIKTHDPDPSDQMHAIPQVNLTTDMYSTRAMRWIFYSKTWFHNKLLEVESSSHDLGGPVRVFTIPYLDIDRIFSEMQSFETRTNVIFLFFGLKDFISDSGEAITDIELILSNLTISTENNEVNLFETFEDVTSPCPPFCREHGFNLLNS